MKSGTPLMIILSSYCDPKSKFGGEKMIGAFGCGDENGVWKVVRILDLTKPPPNWETLDSIAGT